MRYMRKQLLILAALLLSMAGMAQTVNSTDGNFTSTLADGALNLRTTTSGVGTNRLTILGAPGATAGFVGIGLGAGTPVDLLHIGGTARANQLNLVNGVLNTTSGTTNMSFNINGTTRMTLLSGGNVGIGTTSPADQLHVTGTARANQLNLIGGTINTTTGTTNMSFNINGTNRMTLLAANGNFGIGTNAPGAQLQVNSSAATAIGQVVRGASAQTADLQQWQNNAGTNLLRIDPAGNIRAGAADQYVYGFNAQSYINLYNSSTGQIDLKGLNNSGVRVLGSLTVDNNIMPSGSVGLASDQTLYSSNSSGALIKLYDATTGQLSIRASTSQASFSRIRMQTGTTPTDRLLIDENGQVGIGTSTPEAKLHIKDGHLLIDNSLNGGNASIFTGTGTTELSRYLQIINSPGLLNASGLKAGGLLVADTYTYANPTKNDLVVKGKVAVGKPTPVYDLDVAGTINASNILVGGAPIGGAFSGTVGQVPFVNTTNNGYIGSSSLTFLSATNQFITGNNNTAPAGSNTFTSGDQNVNKGLYGSAMFGELSEIDVNVGSALAAGEGVYVAAYGGKAVGRGSAIRPGAYFSFAGGWWEPGSTTGKTNLKVPQVSGTSSFGFYSTDPGQDDNHGVRAVSSAILGGKNSDIPPGSHYSVVLGGVGIKARDNDPQQVYVPNFNIVNAPGVDNSGSQVLLRDATTGQIKYREATTFSQWITTGANINYATGNVGIGTPLTTNPNGYRLAVNGKIGAKDVQVEVASATWPDYVFSTNYNLPSLAEVAEYIQANKHLKEVPSAEQIEKEGHSLGEMDKILLKKIEELTLYLIQQQKQIEELKRKVEAKK